MMQTALDKLLHFAQNEIRQSQNLTELENVRIKFLGRKGKIRLLFQNINKIPSHQKKQYGQDLNLVKKTLESNIQKRLQKIVPSKNQPSQKPNQLHQLKKIGHLHPITVTQNQLNLLFQSLGFSTYQGPEIETDEFCFERLNVPKNHPARELQDTIYIHQPKILLRTQGSSIEARLLANHQPPFKTAFPCIVYRNEKVNKSNHFIFHHYQGVAIDKNLSLKDLFGTINLLFKKLYGPKVCIRFRPKYYPEVEPGVGPDMQCFACHGTGCSICKGAGWIEMGGAGIIHPNVLKKAGIDSKKWRGFAFGLGLDRWVMANYNIKDIRTLLGGNLAYKPNQT